MSSAEPSNRSAAVEAAEWYARLRAQDVTEIDGLRFRAWISGSPERRREFEALEGVWQGLSHLEQSPVMQRTREAIAARRRLAAQPRKRRLWAVAATIILCVGVASWLWYSQTSNVYVTELGELRALRLSDGSVVTLNTATEAKVHYSDTERWIELLEGQASFEVAKDSARPFVVTVSGGEVRALGTVFEIYKEKDKVTVTLLEGKVTVSPSLHRSSASKPSSSLPDTDFKNESIPLVLNPGEQISYALSANVAALQRIEISDMDIPRVTAWRVRKLAFKDTLLIDAIAEANRYSTEKIVLEAPGMETARLSGSFEAGKNDALAEGLRSFFNLEIKRRGERIVLTRSAQ